MSFCDFAFGQGCPNTCFETIHRLPAGIASEARDVSPEILTRWSVTRQRAGRRAAHESVDSCDDIGDRSGVSGSDVIDRSGRALFEYSSQRLGHIVYVDEVMSIVWSS